MPVSNYIFLLAATAACLVCSRDLHANSRRAEIDSKSSMIVATAYKAGIMSMLAHDHAISPKKWTADICLDPSAPERGRTMVSLDARSLEIDSTDALKNAKMATTLSASDRASLQQKIHGPRFFNSSKYPTIRFVSRKIKEEGSSSFELTGDLTIRDRTQPIIVVVHTTTEPSGGKHYAGTFSLKQSDFGIEPESVAGVIKVQDEISVAFEINAKFTAASCK